MRYIDQIQRKLDKLHYYILDISILTYLLLHFYEKNAIWKVVYDNDHNIFGHFCQEARYDSYTNKV